MIWLGAKGAVGPEIVTIVGPHWQYKA